MPILFTAIALLSTACNQPNIEGPTDASVGIAEEIDIPEEKRMEIFFAVETAMLEAESDPEWLRLEKLIRSNSGDDRVGQWLEEQEAIDDKYVMPVLNRFNVSESQSAAIFVEGAKKRWTEQSGRKTTLNTPAPI